VKKTCAASSERGLRLAEACWTFENRSYLPSSASRFITSDIHSSAGSQPPDFISKGIPSAKSQTNGNACLEKVCKIPLAAGDGSQVQSVEHLSERRSTAIAKHTFTATAIPASYSAVSLRSASPTSRDSVVNASIWRFVNTSPHVTIP